MDLIGIFEKIFRWILWKIVTFEFVITDAVYEAVKSIACFNILGEQKGWTYFTIFIDLFLGFFIIFRLSKRYLKTLIDDEEAQKLNAMSIIVKVAAIGFLIVALPYILKAFGNLLSNMISVIESTFSVQSNKFSTVILSTFGDVPSDLWDRLIEFDINAEGVETTYLYLNNFSDLICIVLSGLFGIYLITLIGLQIGSRIVGMILRLIIAPYSLSTIVEERNSNFTTWWQLFVSDFLSTYLQMVLLIVGTTLVLGIDFNTENALIGGIAKIIAYTGGLMAILNAPSGISQLIGGDIGVTSTLQSMQTSMMGANLMSKGASLIGKAGLTAGAAAVYGTGRVLGGSSIGSQIKNTTGGGTSFVGQILGGRKWGQDGNSETGESDIKMRMEQDPVKRGSKVSGATVGGTAKNIKDAIANGNLGDLTDALKNGRISPNIAKKFTEMDTGRSVKDMLNDGNLKGYAGVALRGINKGSSALYGMSSNFLSKGQTSGKGKGNPNPMNNPFMQPTFSPQNMNGMNNNGGENA